MQSYTDFNILNPYSSNEDGKLWSSFIQQSSGGAFDGFETPLYPNSIFSVGPDTSTLPHRPIVLDYSSMSSPPDFAPFQDLIDRRNWCLSNFRLSTKQAAALREENVNLQRANSELNKQLSQLQQQVVSTSVSDAMTMFPSGNSILNCFERMKIGEKGTMATGKRAASGVENVDPVKKTDAEWIKLPKSISVRSNGYLKTVQPGDGSASRSRAVDRVKPVSDMQKVYVRGKEDKDPLELKVYNQGMTKTELCNKWQQTGACPYGDHCQFAHGIEELRPVIRHPRYKTQVCRMVLAGDPCPYSHRCHFRHALNEEEKLTGRHFSS